MFSPPAPQTRRVGVFPASLFTWIFTALTPLGTGAAPEIPPPEFVAPTQEFIRRQEAAPAMVPGELAVPTAQVGGAWVPLGPAPTRSGQVSVPPNNDIAGAIQAIAAHPTNADILYIGAVNGGVWRTTNATAATPTWTPLTDAQASLSVGSLEFDPTDGTSQTLVVGGARTSSFGAVGGSLSGMLRSIDGGNTWTALGTATFANEHLTSVAARGSVLLAASDSIWAGGSGSGLFRSTTTGASFTQVSGAGGTGLPTGPVSDLVGDPQVSTRLFAAVRTAGVFRSTDTGATWTNVTGTISGITASTTRIEMAVHNNGTTHAVFVAVVNSNILASVWRSTDLGVSWTQMDTPVAHNGAQGNIHFSISADRNSANFVYIGGDRITSSPFTGNLFRGNASLALGSQFTTIMDGNANSGSGNTTPHADSREMVMDANGNLIQGDDGGLYRRTSPQSSTGTWGSVIGNLACFEAHDVAYDSVANVGMIGTQDNGTHIQSASGSSIWTFINGGDGGDVAIDDTSTANQSIRYGSSQNLGSFFRKTYNASNGLVSTVFPARTVLAGGPAIGVQFITPIVLNKVDPTRLIIGGSNAAYESLNRGDSVTALTPISAVNGTFTGCPVAYGGYLAGVPNADVLYYGSGTSVKLRTTSGGAIASTAAAFPGGTVQDIVLDSNDWGRVFAAGSSSVYMSTNSGGSWTNITGDLTGVGSIHTLEFFQLNGSACVAAGTNIGVFCSFVSNLGTWARLGTGLPNAVVYDMAYNAVDQVLVIGTMGRSTFLLATGALVPVISPIAASAPTSENCVPANGAVDPAETVTVDFSLKNTGGAATTNLVATLQNSGGVARITTSQNYGAVAPAATVTRSFQFTASGTCGGTITATFQLQDGATDLGNVTFVIRLGVFQPVNGTLENFDAVTAPALPPSWVATVASGTPAAWATSTTSSDAGANNAFATPTTTISDNRLDSPSIAITSSTAQVTFRHRWNTETDYDGGVLEIAIGAGAFTDLLAAGGSFAAGGYNLTLLAGDNPISGRQAWSSSFDTAYTTTTANLPPAAAGQNIRLRWRLGCDSSVSPTGAVWRIDTISLSDGTYACCGAAPVFTSALPPGATQDTPYNHTFTTSGTPPPSFSVTAGTLPAGLTLVGAAISGTPTTPGNNPGITVTASNGLTPNATQTFGITVTAVPHAPAGTDKTIATNEDTAYIFTAADFGFTDPLETAPHSFLAVKVTTLPASGTLTRNAVAVSAGAFIPISDINAGLFKFVPVANANGIPYASFTFQVQDNGGGGADLDLSPNTMTVNVAAINDAPMITGQQTLSTAEETALTVVFANLTVTDPDNTYPTGFTLTVQNGTNYTRSGNTITPAADFNGTLTVPVLVNDGAANSNIFNLAVSVTAVNDAPVITGQQTLSTAEETALTIVFANLTVTDPDNNYPTGFTLTVQNGTNYTRSGNTITPAADFNGTLTVPVLVNDGAANSNTFNLSVTVTAVNDAPVITGQQTLSTAEETALTIVFANLTVTDPDNTYPTGFTLTVQNGTNYTRSGNTITPAVNFNGTLTVPVLVNDGTANSNIFNLSVTVTAVNDAPVITGQQTLSTAEETALTIVFANLTVTDPDNTYPTGFTLTVQNGTNYTRSGNTITPAADFNGTLTVPVLVNDGSANSNIFNLAVSVTAVNDAPVITGQQVLSTAEETALTVVFANLTVTDPDNTYPTGFTLTVQNGTNYTRSGNTITPAVDFNGTITVPVTVNDGIDPSAVFNLSITVTAVNDAPTLAALGDLELPEDATEQTVNLAGIGTGAANETDTLTVTATSSNPTLIADPTVTYTSAEATGSLKFTPAANLSGQATITVTVDDGQPLNHETSRTFIVNVTAVNDVPSFTKGANPSVLEDAGAQVVSGWATALSSGPADEAGQTLSFIVSSTNSGLFANAPAIASNGTLSFTPAANANGSATVTVQIMDNGGIAGGGVDTSAAQTFSIAVTSVNDAPSFVKGPPQNVLQNAGAQTVNGWATAIATGPADESAQTLNFTVTTDNDALFSALPAVSPGGTLTFTPAPAVNGSATVTVVLHDNGGTDHIGVDASAPQTFVINSGAVNDPPSFTIGGDQSVAQEAGPQTVPGFATNILAGPPDEAAQVLDFQIDVDKPGLFTALPTISATTGDLTFTPDATASDTAIITVRLHDNGASVAPDVALSAPQTFKIAVTSFVEELGTYNGLALPDAAATPGADKTGLLKLTVAKKGKVTGKLKLGAFSHSFKGTINNAGVVSFGKTNAAFVALKRKAPLSALTLSDLRVDVGGGTDSLTATVTDGGAAFATITADRALYSSKKDPLFPRMNVPAALIGKYTVIFDEPVAPDPLFTDFPHGDGFGTLTVKSTGFAKISGRLADGSKISYANALSKRNFWPLWVPFAKGTGALAGPVHFQSLVGPPASNIDGLGLHWFKPKNLSADIYPNGWPGGLTTDFVGSTYIVPPKDMPDSVLPGLEFLAVDADGNAKFTLTGGGLAIPFNKALTISQQNKVRVVTEGPDKMKMTIKASSGLLKGSFVPPGGTKAVKFQGVIFQAQQFGSGYFLGPTESGAVTLVPAATPGVP